MQRADQMMGNLFFRQVNPSEINGMEYHELKYWNDWHEAMNKADNDAIEKAKREFRRKNK